MALTSTILSTTSSAVFSSQGNSAITTMYICNTGDVPVLFNLHAVPDGAVGDMTNVIYYNVPLESRDTYVINDEKIVLSPGESIQGSIVDPNLVLNNGLANTEWNDDNVYVAYWSNDLEHYIVGGASGKIALSNTGERWDTVIKLTDNNWTSGIDVNDITRISYKRYVAVGNNGLVATSTNGVNWDVSSSLNNTSWGNGDIYAIANNGSFYVAVGAEARIATSVDGLDWEFQSNLSQTSWGSNDIWSIIWDGEKFLIGGEGGRLASSVDAVTWTYIDSLKNNLAWGLTTRVTGLAYSGSSSLGYLAVTRDSNKVATSTDGVNWIYSNGLANIGDSVAPGAAAVIFRPGYGFYILGLVPRIYQLTLDENWIEVDNDLLQQPWGSHYGTDIIWNSSRAEFMAVGANARVATSPDALTWTLRTQSENANISLPNVVVTVSSINI